LLGIINDLLNFSRIEAGRITYDMKPMSFGRAIRAVLPMIDPQAKQRELDVRVVETADYQVVADSTKVEQILLNLLSNAIKFTPPGGSISLSGASTERTVSISVTDTGRGIAREKQERIFEPFVRIDDGFSRTTEGTGLGLAISRDLARAMGGDLVVESTPGAGATFTLTIPRSA
jgi:signal transduction histidine kinase